MDVLRAIWTDERGFVITIELVLIVTILVIGLVAGLTALRDALVAELADVGAAVQELNQSYESTGTTTPVGQTGGSAFLDTADSAGASPALSGQSDACIIMVGPSQEL